MTKEEINSLIASEKKRLGKPTHLKEAQHDLMDSCEDTFKSAMKDMSSNNKLPNGMHYTPRQSDMEVMKEVLIPKPTVWNYIMLPFMLAFHMTLLFLSKFKLGRKIIIFAIKKWGKKPFQKDSK